jgi:hypothetical protein
MRRASWLVPVHPWGDEDQVGTLPLGLDRRLSGMDPVRTSLVARRLDDPAGRRPAHCDWLPGVLVGKVSLFDLGAEGVHVYMNDPARILIHGEGSSRPVGSAIHVAERIGSLPVESQPASQIGPASR